MKKLPGQNVAFTLIELLVVIGILAVLATCSLSALARTRPQAQRITCSNNLKQVGVAFQSWANSHNGNTPMNPGAPQPAMRGAPRASGLRAQYLYQVFRCMSNELVTPRISVLPG